MSIALWMCQGLLAAVFFLSGARKSTQSKERMLASGQTGVRAYGLPFIRVIAVCELLGAVGLIVPSATSILPVLTPLAACGLGIIMLGAARAHALLHEPKNVAANFVLLALCLFVAIGRLA
jgi:uncharacterized membrane protein YphA (DoxX/SURF4 family)